MKKTLRVMLALALTVMLMAGCGKPGEQDTPPEGQPDTTPETPVAEAAYPQLTAPQEGDTIAVIETSEGTIKAVLYPEYAPLAVENFIALANSDYYKDMLFHRVVDGFVIQTGDPTGTGRGGESASGSTFVNETSPSLHHFAGALGMANAGTDLNKSQFYIVSGTTVSTDLMNQMKAITDGSFPTEVIEGYKKLGGQPALDYRYTVFGQVYEGMDVVAKINKVKVDGDSRPTADMKLISVTIETYTAAKADD